MASLLLVVVAAALVAWPVACDELHREVTIGSVVKLRHERLKVHLHSHEVAYGSGSGQQSVTGFNGGDDSNDYWAIRCPHKKPKCKQGQVVKDGDSFRLQHMVTKKWLHSHMHNSPLSGNFEVSGYGSETQSDTGDHWKLEIEGSGSVWKRDQKVRLLHEDIRAYLHSHNMQYGRPIAGQYENHVDDGCSILVASFYHRPSTDRNEVCATQKKNPDNLWMATEGVYLPKSE